MEKRAVTEDITAGSLSGNAGRLAERSRKRETSRLVQVLATAPHAVITLSPSGGVQDWNPAAERIFGRAQASMGGVAFEPLLIGINGDRPLYDRLLDGEQIRGLECRAWHADGHRIWVRITASLLQDEEEIAGGVLLCVEDITAERERARELDSARAAAEGALQAKRQFLSLVSHELRTPLNPIIGMTDLLLETADNDDLRSGLEMIQEGGRQLHRLIDDLLYVVRLDHETAAEEPAQLVDLRSVLQDLVKDFTPRARRNGLLLEFSAASLPREPVRINIVGFLQVLNNLLENAIKFTEEGRVWIEVSSEIQQGEEHLIISVNDTGIGIPSDRMTEIFEPFVQVDSSLARQYGGSGLGLTIARKMAHKLGAELAVTSQRGVGSRFEFQISMERLMGPGRATRQAVQALVVDDHLEGCQVLSRALQEMGCCVRGVTSMVDACRMMEGGEGVQLVLLATDSLILDAIELRQVIRRRWRSGSEPLLVGLTTRRGDMDDLLTDFDTLDSVLSRPVRLPDLEAAISRARRAS